MKARESHLTWENAVRLMANFPRQTRDVQPLNAVCLDAEMSWHDSALTGRGDVGSGIRPDSLGGSMRVERVQNELHFPILQKYFLIIPWIRTIGKKLLLHNQIKVNLWARWLVEINWSRFHTDHTETMRL